MAIFYPPMDPDHLAPAEKAGDIAERIVLKALSNLDDAWRIFHGVNWRFTDKFGEHAGEADAIVFHPDLGLLIIEVKGGGVRCKDGEWYHVDIYSGLPKARMNLSPFSQAQRSRYYFQDRLGNTPLGQGILKRTAFTHTAWFPDFEWHGPTPPEMPTGAFVLDHRHLDDPERHLRDLLSQAGPPGRTPWTTTEINHLIRSISPEINLSPPLGLALGAIRQELFRLTESQIKVLMALKDMNRLLVSGCAGSGKTLLAVRLAQDHLRRGRRVLFTCFNRNLAASLVGEFEGFPGIDVVNFHELVRLVCQRQRIPYLVPDGEKLRQEFFKSECAELLLRASEGVSQRYDTIIVDEAFDFLDTWWVAVESLGVPGCSLYAFYDPSQNVFTDKENWRPPFSAEPVCLETNVRNTRPVGEYARRLGGVAQAPNYLVDQGPEPEELESGPGGGLAKCLADLLTRLIAKRKVPAQEIVVLSPYRWSGERLGLGKLVEDRPDLFQTDLAKPARDKVRIGTIQAFKGLEADVVILCGVDGRLPACSQANLYTGATRARSMLFLIR